MKPEKFKESIKKIYGKIGRRNFIIIGAVFLIAAVVAVNVIVYSSKDDEGFDYSQSAGMNGDGSSADGTNNGGDTNTSTEGDSYFSSVQVNRQRTRDEAIEVLQSVVDNASATETAKNEALSEINKLALVMETEANIESLIVAKGFEECVAVISGENVSIVVKSDELLASEISQINEIVYEQAGIEPVNINIIVR